MRSLSVRKMLRRALTKAGAVNFRPAPLRSTCPPLRLEALEDRTAPATFTVMNTNDSGMASFPQPIVDPNPSSDAATIAFDIGGGGVQTIRVLSALPTITHAVVIDGTTQPGYSGAPLVVLNGSSAGLGVRGLEISAGNSTVKGLVVNGFQTIG